MDEELHLCKWKGRLWPAKVVGDAPRSSRRKDNVMVEILGEKKRLLVQQGEMSSLTEKSIEAIAVQLGQDGTKTKDPTVEVSYRKALRLALDALSTRCGLSSAATGSPRRSLRLSQHVSPLPGSPPCSQTSACRADGAQRQLNGTSSPTRVSPRSRQTVQRASAEVPKGEGRGRADNLRQGGVQLPAEHSIQSPSGPPAPPEERGRSKRKGTDEGLGSEKQPHESDSLPPCSIVDAFAQATRRNDQRVPEEPSDGMSAARRAKRRRVGKQGEQDNDEAAQGCATEAPKGQKGAKAQAALSRTSPAKTNGLARGRVKEVVASSQADRTLAGLPSSVPGPCISTQRTCSWKVRFSPRHPPPASPASESLLLPFDPAAVSTPQRRAKGRKCQLFTSSCAKEQEPQSVAVPGRAGVKWRQARPGEEDEPAEEGGQVQQGSGPGAPCSVKNAQLGGGSVCSASTESSEEDGLRAWTFLPSRLHSEPQEPDTALSPGTGETSFSSDLSIELSMQEDPSTLDSSLLEEEREEPEEEELPSFLLQMDRKGLAIKEGNCVWCKFRNFPYWPAVVKAINRKQKKASVIFIDDALLDQKRVHKGFSVSMKNLKPFDCELTDELECSAKVKYSAVITWGLELIQDYRIRVACGSFSGSFMDYFADDISGPVRKTYSNSSPDTSCPSNDVTEEPSSQNGSEAASPDVQYTRIRRKLLPDRSKAARNVANEKLVRFIVDKRGVEEHLQAVISGQVSSKWLVALLKSSRTVDLYKTYLEDEQQVDTVYRYLEDMYKSASRTAPCLTRVDRVRLILDVLFPEAVVHAIAGVDKISLEKAKDKFLEGPSFNTREREAFNKVIEEQMTRKGGTQCPAS